MTAWREKFQSLMEIASLYLLYIKHAVVKGYHAFQIKPPISLVKMTVDREYTNIHDENACLVWLPLLDQFPDIMHDTVTDDKTHFKLSDIAGLPIGHIPR